MDKSSEKNTSIWKALESVKFSVKVGENAGRSDRMFYKLMEDGKNNNDIDKLYRYINASENGTGTPYDENVSKLITKAYEADPFRLFQIISNKNELLYYWALLSMCKMEYICFFVTQNTQYTLFYYECARQIVNRFSESEYTKDGLPEAVVHIANKSQQLWKRWIRRFEHNKIWSRAIGVVLEKASKAALLTYAKTISLDMHNENELLKIITGHLLGFSDGQCLRIIRIISKTICRRWEHIIYMKKLEKRSYNDIFISPYINVIIYSLAHQLNNRWEKKLIRLLDIFKSDMQKWFVSITDMSRYYYLDLSYIYYLLIIKNNNDREKFNFNIIDELRVLKSLVERYSYLGKDADESEFKEFMNLLVKLINS